MRIILAAVVLLSASFSQAQNMARDNRVAFVINYDHGFVSMPEFDTYAEALAGDLYETQSNAIGMEMALRYYAPYYIAAHVGAGALLGKDEITAPGSSGKLKYWNLMLEVPILVGGHYPVHNRIHLHTLLGPSIMAMTGNYWDSSGPGMPDFEGETGVGFQWRLGADFYALESLSFGFELVYRNQSVDVTEKKAGRPVQMPSGKLHHGHALDFSGIGFNVGLRLVI